MNKTLVFDMDGTIADLYGVTDWLPMLRAENPLPYEIAEPMYDMDILVPILNILKGMGWRIEVTTWLSKGSTKSYDAQVASAKRAWLKKHGFPCDKVNCVPYGTPKTSCTERLGGYQIMIDDDERVLDSWTLGSVIDAKQDIIRLLADLIIG